MKKILFLLPYAWQSGSEVVLAQLITGLSKTHHHLAVASNYESELLSSFPQQVKTFCFERFLSAQNPFQKLLNRFFPSRAKFIKNNYFHFLNKAFPADIWYINTIMQPDALEFAEKHEIPCVLHSHEMEQVLTHLDENQIQRMIDYPELIICCSQANAEVMKVLGRKKDIEIHYPGVDFTKIKIKKSPSEIKNILGINENSFVIGMSGNLDANKDPVLFVKIAHTLLKQKQNIHFLWIGGDIHSSTAYYAKKMAGYFGVEKKITFTGHLKDDYYETLNTIDLFLLTSHKDTFPLVMIESAYLGKPIIGFQSGGVQEFVNNEQIGRILNTRNAEGTATHLVSILDNMVQFNGALSNQRALEFEFSKTIDLWQKTLLLK